jgi:hypothetical protein
VIGDSLSLKQWLEISGAIELPEIKRLPLYSVISDLRLYQYVESSSCNKIMHQLLVEAHLLVLCIVTAVQATLRFERVGGVYPQLIERVNQSHLILLLFRPLLFWVSAPSVFCDFRDYFQDVVAGDLQALRFLGGYSLVFDSPVTRQADQRYVITALWSILLMIIGGSDRFEVFLSMGMMLSFVLALCQFARSESCCHLFSSHHYVDELPVSLSRRYVNSVYKKQYHADCVNPHLVCLIYLIHAKNIAGLRLVAEPVTIAPDGMCYDKVNFILWCQYSLQRWGQLRSPVKTVHEMVLPGYSFWREYQLLGSLSESLSLRGGISKELLQNPVMSPYGHLFENETISTWLRQHKSCPLTRRPLYRSQLVSAMGLVAIREQDLLASDSAHPRFHSAVV